MVAVIKRFDFTPTPIFTKAGEKSGILSLLLLGSNKINRNSQSHFNRRSPTRQTTYGKGKPHALFPIPLAAILALRAISPQAGYTDLSFPCCLPQTLQSEHQTSAFFHAQSPTTPHPAHLHSIFARVLAEFRIPPLSRVLQGACPRSSSDLLPPCSPTCLHPLSAGFPPSIETVGAGAASSTGPAAWHRHFLSPPQCLTSLISNTS